ncbi:MAG: hypothetical protein JWQ09_2358 [Segetibacter sp.]|nr:hypothetical protein [Segetibacter sp.]
MPGIVDDSAFMNNDTLIYDTEGQIFSKGYKVSIDRTYPALSSPWQTIFTMAYMYARRDKNGIVNLYDNTTKDRVNYFLSTAGAKPFLDEVSRAAKANLVILAGFKYDNGYMIYSKDDEMGIHENFIVKQGNKYKLAAINDSVPLRWNVGMYFKFMPAPMFTVGDISLPDSLAYEDSVKVSVAMPQPGRWLAVFTDKAGDAVPLLVQDNGINDLDAGAGKVTFFFHGGTFINRGRYTFYITSFNYPVLKVSKNFFIPQARHTISIY